MRELLKDALAFALRYHAELPDRRVVPSRKAVEALAQLDRPLSESGTASREVLAELDALAGPATVATVGGRYFGFVIGGALPVTVAASWLAAAWDQNAAFEVLSPAGVALGCATWLWVGLGRSGLPEGLPAAAEFAAAQGDDGVGSAYGPAHAGLLEAVTDDGLAPGLDDTRADEEAAVTKVGVAHAVGVGLEVGDGLSDLGLATGRA